jgi:lysophospholipase L1-like esterase
VTASPAASSATMATAPPSRSFGLFYTEWRALSSERSRGRCGRARNSALLLAVAVALGLVVGAVAAPVSASVLVVGDSLGVGTEPALRAALPDLEIEADSLGGRPSRPGVGILAERLSPEHDTVVFDLGTNDGPAAVGITAASLLAARDLAVGRCLVVATLNHPPVAGIPIDAQNSMIRRFAAGTPNVALVEWRGAAASTPGALLRDGVHATGAGYALRAQLFADAIRGCVSTGGGAGVPAPDGRRAATTDRPARRVPQPAGPSLETRLATAVVARLGADGGPLALARGAAAAVVAAATSLREVLTPRGPEPVLGAER